MAWLGQNWIYILLVIGVFFMMRRGGMGCGPGVGRHNHSGHESVPQPESESNIDPVSGQTVDPQTAVTSAYQGRIYYFTTRENRDRFEATPEQYAAKPQAEHGQRHGCC